MRFIEKKFDRVEIMILWICESDEIWIISQEVVNLQVDKKMWVISCGKFHYFDAFI